MAKKQKYYVVWFGNPTGIFDSWEECQLSIKGVKGAQYKSFETFAEAKIAYNKEYADYKGKSKKKKNTFTRRTKKNRRSGPVYHLGRCRIQRQSR